jgi:Tol biopolymer transport system component
MGSQHTKILSLLAVGIAIAVALLSLARVLHANAPARNGKIVFVESLDPNLSVEAFTVNPDGSDLRQLTSFGSSGFIANSPQWSRDGRHLVFAAFTPDGVSQIWIMNPDGTNPHVIFTDALPAIDFNATFSSDGSHIGFTRCRDQGPPCAIFQIRSDGSDLTAITDFDVNPDIIDAFPRYSPDGREVVFTNLSRDGVLQAIYSAQTNGAHIRRLTAPAIGGANGDFSPNGDRIAFDDNDGFCFGCFFPHSEISIMDSDGDRFHEITNLPDFINIDPSWAPEGNALVFEQDAADFSRSELLILDFNQDGGHGHGIHHGKGRRNHQPGPVGRMKMSDRKGHLKTLVGTGFDPHWGSIPQF